MHGGEPRRFCRSLRPARERTIEPDPFDAAIEGPVGHVCPEAPGKSSGRGRFDRVLEYPHPDLLSRGMVMRSRAGILPSFCSLDNNGSPKSSELYRPDCLYEKPKRAY